MNKNVVKDILLTIFMPYIGWIFAAAGMITFVFSIRYHYTYLTILLALVFFVFAFTFSIILITGRLETYRTNHPLLKYIFLPGWKVDLNGKFGRYFVGPFLFIITTLLLIFAVYVFFNAPGKP